MFFSWIEKRANYTHSIFCFLLMVMIQRTLVFITLLTVSLAPVFANFSDTTDHIYQEDIRQMVELDVVQWYPWNVFNPDWAITRAELLKIIMLAADITLNTGSESCFPDIKASDRFIDYVCTAKTMGIIKWYEDGTFRPNTPVLFSEGIKIGLEGFGISIREEKKKEAWYERYMDFVHDNTIFSRYNIYPEKGMTRAMMTHLAASIINKGTQGWSNTRDNRSVWCAAPAPNFTPSAIELNGTLRNIITDVGPRYNQSKPAKLIVAFHGRTNPNTLVRTYYKIDRASDGNTIIVYPAGLPEEGPVRSWMNPGEKATSLRDYALFDKIVEEFSDMYCIDQDEIYVVWHSLGGWFTNNLACARGNVIRGIGSVGGSSTLSSSNCSGPVSAMIMHNPEDRLASFAWGEAARNTLLAQNKCNADEYKALPNSPEEGHCIEYTSCLAGSAVVWCPHSDSIENGRYYPHTWPDFAWSEFRKFFTQRI